MISLTQHIGNLNTAWKILVLVVLICSVNSIAAAQSIRFTDKGQSNDGDSLTNVLRGKYSRKGKTGLDSLSDRWKAPSSFGKYDFKKDSLSDRMAKFRNFKSPEAPSLYLRNNRKTTKYTGFYKKAEKFKQAHDPTGALNKYSNLKLDSSTVFNNKFMRKYSDSIKNLLPKPPTPPSQEVPKEQLVKEVNDKFLSKADSLGDSTASGYSDEFEKRKKMLDLNYAQIQQAEKMDLKPLAHTLVPKKLLAKVERIRSKDLKAARIKLDEKETAARTKLTTFRQKETFWQKSYFEGVVGLSSNGSGVQVSPAFAYHIVPSWSIGAGPNIIVNKNNNDIRFDVGVRLLTKYELFERKVYLQAEDQVTPNVIGIENKTFTQHNLSSGGGYVVPLFSPLTFNLSIMYRFYSSGEVNNPPSNWIFRIGISTNKKNK